MLLTKHVFPHFAVSRLMEEEKMRAEKKSARAAATHLQSGSFPDCGHNDAKSSPGSNRGWL